MSLVTYSLTNSCIRKKKLNNYNKINNLNQCLHTLINQSLDLANIEPAKMLLKNKVIDINVPYLPPLPANASPTPLSHI